MLRQAKIKIIVGRIAWHWLFINTERKKINPIVDKLLLQGQKLSSPGLLAADRKLNEHCLSVLKLTEEYKRLTGITLNEKGGVM